MRVVVGTMHDGRAARPRISRGRLWRRRISAVKSDAAEFPDWIETPFSLVIWQIFHNIF
jgi:hypothetical protein